MNKECDHIIGIADGKLTTRFEYVRGMYIGAFTDFAYCPKCGAKIGWRILRIIADYKRRNEVIDKWLLKETGETFDQMLDRLSGDSDECDERIIEEYSELMLRRNRDKDGGPDQQSHRHAARSPSIGAGVSQVCIAADSQSWFSGGNLDTSLTLGKGFQRVRITYMFAVRPSCQVFLDDSYCNRSNYRIRTMLHAIPRRILQLGCNT